MTNLTNRTVLSKQKGEKKPETPLNSFQKQFAEHILSGFWFRGKDPNDFTNSDGLIRAASFLINSMVDYRHGYQKEWEPLLELLSNIQKSIYESRKHKDVSFFVSQFKNENDCIRALVLLSKYCSDTFCEVKDSTLLYIEISVFVELFYCGISIEKGGKHGA